MLVTFLIGASRNASVEKTLLIILQPARTMQVDAHSHAEDVIGAGAGDGGEAGALRERCAARAGLIRGVEHEAAPW